jgi:hypothetical protein
MNPIPGLSKGPAPVILIGGEPLSAEHGTTDVVAALTAVPLPGGNNEFALYEAGLLGVSKAHNVLPALLAYTATTRAPDEPIETIIRDLIVDLAHLADLFAEDDHRITDLFDRAFPAYQRERDGDL